MDTHIGISMSELLGMTGAPAVEAWGILGRPIPLTADVLSYAFIMAELASHGTAYCLATMVWAYGMTALAKRDAIMRSRGVRALTVAVQWLRQLMTAGRWNV